MKKVRLISAAIIIASLVLSSCGGISKMKDNAALLKYTVTPAVLEMHGGKVTFSVTGKCPEKFFNKKAIMTLKPVIKYAGQTLELPTKAYQGESVQANNEVIPYATGGEMKYSATFDYKDEMMTSELVMNASIQVGTKTPIEVPGVKIADGIIATANLVDKTPKGTTERDNFQRVTDQTVAATINYLIQQSNIRPTELKKEEIVKFEKFLADLKNQPRVTLKSLQVDAYASPDGALALNEKVSNGRKGTADSYLSQKAKKAGIKVDQNIYNAKSTTEDWDGFKSLVEKSNIQDKELILRVLSMYSDPEVREKEIKNMAATFNVLAQEILPKLRRSDLKANVEVSGYTDEELAELVVSDPDKLGLEELLYAAARLENADQKLAAYQKAAEKFPTDHRAKNNIGVMLLKQGKVAEAKEAFESAKAIKETDIVNANLGAVALAQGDLTKAEELLTASLGAGEAANYNLGTVKIIKGEYQAAINYFGAMCEGNAGLAILLQGNNDGALKNLECINDPSGVVYYMKAIIGARTQNENLLFTNLRSAVGKESKWKDYAKKDLEFRNYFDKETFKSIVQ